MTETYPDHPNLTGNYAPLRMECDIQDLIIEGEVPKDLFGSYYRNGPDPQFPPMGGQYHWFAGDGMIHAFNFENGKISYKNRWVQTSKWKQERKAGRSLINALNPMESDPIYNFNSSDGTANTNIIYHANKLLALEEGHPPFELDPISLESKGSWDYKKKLNSAMTAHPKIDPKTGEMFGFSYGFGDNKMTYFVIDASGELTTYSEFETPYSSMVHDFIVTTEHVIFPIFPLIIDFNLVAKGMSPIAWDSNRLSQIGVMPRNGTVKDIKWLEDDPCFVFHPMNAYTDGDKIIADMMQFEEAPLFPHLDGSIPDNKKAEARLNRWEIDLTSNSGSIKKDYLDEHIGEFPRLDERFSMSNYRYGIYASNHGDSPKGISFNSVTRYDYETGNKEFFTLSEFDAVGEPIFVPKSSDAEEGVGYVIALAYLGKENRSDLMIFDAENISSGPMAKAMLPHRIPYGFHGNWRPGS